MPLFSPDLRPTSVRLRDYQLTAVGRIREEFEKGRKSTLLVLPTGCGKTITFGFVARQYAHESRRTLVLAHREELIGQAAGAIESLGMNVGIEMAEHRARLGGDPHVVVGSVQTFQRKRLASWPKDYFALVVTDEAHHAVSDSYQNIYRHFAGVPHLGVTATPDRGDRINLGLIYESVAFEYTLLDAILAGYLSRIRVVQCDIQVDLREIRTTGGDLNSDDVAEAIRPHVRKIANAVRQEVGDRPTIIFTPDVGSAQAVATAIDSIGVKAVWVSGDDPDRADKITRYKSGEYQVLCNCALLTEGFDAPRTSAIVPLRATKSRSLYAQMVGRGTRLAEGKTDCLIVDFAWIAGRHQLVKPTELLTNRITADPDLERRAALRAQELMEQGDESDLLDAIEQATYEEQFVERARKLSLKIKKEKLQYKRTQYDPLATYQALSIPEPPRESRPQPATEKQIACLTKWGIPGADSISRKHAGVLIGYYRERFEKGLATYKQCNWLIANGFPPDQVRTMTREQASRELDRIFGGDRRSAS